MSTSRSVQAAQRRRSGPPEPQAPGRSIPQPSINSAQMFASQARGGPGPNIPSGRLAGQQATLQQQQMQQHQHQQQMQQQQQQSIGNINKMTIPQAITLITLRLGSLESKMIELDTTSTGISHVEGHENMILVDAEVIHSITSRLNDLENRPTTTSTSSSLPSADSVLLKQQVDSIKLAVTQQKAAVIKENKELKNQIETLKKELEATKEVLVLLQNITMDNSQKIMNFSLNNELDENIDLSAEYNFDEENNVDQDQNEIIGTNLKELIETEINAEH